MVSKNLVITLVLSQRGKALADGRTSNQLCAVFNKLITKMLNTRLSTLLSLIISPNEVFLSLGASLGKKIWLQNFSIL